METYIIALKELKISNKIILTILELFQLEDYLSLFSGDYISLQFKFNLPLDKYSNALSNKDILNSAIEKAKEIKQLSKKNKIKILLFNDKRYPLSLKNISNPPPIIYYKGRGFYKKHIKSIACVGTRSITDFGIGAAESIVPSLVKEGFTIVSGLALGIDYLSHRICLENEGTTIAVLAHGLDMVYPKSSSGLAESILENNGLLVSEYPIGTTPDKFRFIERNRIVSGLSKGTVVFETKEKSGTMHTVNDTIEQGKPVFCPVPRNFNNTTIALAKLIQSGTARAIPSRNAFEVIVLGTGYRLKDKDKILELKNKASLEIINNIKIDTVDNLNDIQFEDFKYSGIKVDDTLYQKYKEVLKENNLSNKDLFNAFMLSVISSNKK